MHRTCHVACLMEICGDKLQMVSRKRLVHAGEINAEQVVF